MSRLKQPKLQHDIAYIIYVQVESYGLKTPGVRATFKTWAMVLLGLFSRQRVVEEEMAPNAMLVSYRKKCVHFNYE